MKVPGFTWRKKHARWIHGYKNVWRRMGGTKRSRLSWMLAHTKGEIGVYRGIAFCELDQKHYWFGKTGWSNTP